MMGESSAEGTRATLEDMTKQIKQLVDENERLRAGQVAANNTGGASSASGSTATPAAPAIIPATVQLQEFLAPFERGSREKLLANLKLGQLTAKAVNAKLEGLSLKASKAKQMAELSEQLIEKLITRTARPEQELLHEKLAQMAVEWGVSTKVAGSASTQADYKLLARLIAAAIVLEQ